MECPTVMVTLGKRGSAVYRPDEYLESPALALRVVDRIGAGDAVFAITSLCAAKRMPADLLGFIGNVVGAQAVNIVGNSSSIERPAVFKTIDSLLK
jgi:sugar/nucleoside kinase (ribokinase family)